MMSSPCRASEFYCSDFEKSSWTVFAGVDGSKQPQDFGVNADVGGQFRINWIKPLNDNGLGLQIGTSLVSTSNAVRVYELLGENGGRVQSYTTVGLFQRYDNGWHWGVGYDYLYQESFDQFSLGQVRGRIGKKLDCRNEIGVNVALPTQSDEGVFSFGNQRVRLDPIAQGYVYWRRAWESGTQTTLWMGLAEGHGEHNAVTGFSPPNDEVFLFGADILSPLNDYVAVYGETNLMMPSDTGTVDAFLGIEIFPWGGAYTARRARYSAVLPVAAAPSFSVDLSPVR